MSVKQIAMAAAGVSGGGAQPVFIEDVFSTWLYTGNGGVQNINNGIPLASTAEFWGVKFRQGSSQGYGISTDSSGNVYVTGYALDGSGYAFIAKYNTSGTLQWQRKFREINSYGQGISTDSSGNVYVIGYAFDGSGYAFIAKYNTSGTLQWQRKFRQSGSQGYGISTDSSGNVYVTGYANDGSNYAFIAKYNTSGTLQWQRKFREGSSVGYGISTDSSGNVYVTGYANDGNWYAFIAKYNTSGTLQWQRKFRQSDSYGNGISTDSSGNVYVTGYANDGSNYAFIAKYNTSGTLQWQRKFRESNSYGFGVSTDSSGNVYVTGYANDGNNYAFIAKYNTSGTLQWQRKFRESGSIGYGISTDSSGNVYVIGRANDGSDYAFILELAQDGLTTSGTVNNGTLTEGTATDSAGTATDSSGTATDSSGTATDSAGTATDSAGTATSTTQTQAAVEGKGGLVWLKDRSSGQPHALSDTARGTGTSKQLQSNATSAATTDTFTGFTSSGFTLDASFGTGAQNLNAVTYASWTFAEQAKFFDVGTFTGDGTASKAISHNLGSTPGCVFVKRTDGVGGNWFVWHRSSSGTPNNDYLILNDVAAVASTTNAWSSNAFTASQFFVSNNLSTNINGAQYVYYAFAHNAGGFGLSGTDNVISCGSFTTDGSGAGLVGPDLGWEPQFVILKNATSTGSGDWWMMDSMRGMTADSATNYLQSNTSSAASNFSAGTFRVTATGFKIPSNAFASGQTFIYIAIRRGPMRVPTSGSQVFYSQAVAQQSIIDSTGVPFPPDLVNTFSRNGTDRSSVFNLFMFVDRLRGLGTPSDAFSTDSDGPFLVSSSTDAESNTTSYVQLKADGKNITRGGGWGSTGYGNWIYHFLRRAPVFFDEVCYTGDGSPKNITHNLTVAPELLIVKSRGTAGDWAVGGTILGLDNFLRLNLTNGTANNSAYWGNALPNATTFRIGNAANVNDTTTFVALLFASCPGVSKIGTYTGNGSSQTINCGFSTGARFVLIKRTDSTGDWYVWDTARGIVAANDPHLSLNSTAAEVTTNDSIDPDNSGFIVNQVAATNINVNAATYIYLAIA